MRFARPGVLLLALLLAGCGQVRPFSYVDAKEMAGRPGLFTGPPGAIVAYRQ